jgi:hypothetical protein
MNWAIWFSLGFPQLTEQLSSAYLIDEAMPPFQKKILNYIMHADEPAMDVR